MLGAYLIHECIIRPIEKQSTMRISIFNSSGGMNPLENVSTHLFDLNGPK